METVHTPFARPMYIMTKAAGSMCNLACKYCYYLEKNNLYREQQPDRLPRQCRQCRYLFACNGECPKNRFATTADGEPGLNYLCEGYRKYFDHVAPYMDFMANELKHQRPAANVMNFRPA